MQANCQEKFAIFLCDKKDITAHNNAKKGYGDSLQKLVEMKNVVKKFLNTTNAKLRHRKSGFRFDAELNNYGEFPVR